MANEPLESIKFPGIVDTFTVPAVDNTLAVQGAPADAKKVGDEISDIKADFNDVSTEVFYTDYGNELVPTSPAEEQWIDQSVYDFSMTYARHIELYLKVLSNRSGTRSVGYSANSGGYTPLNVNGKTIRIKQSGISKLTVGVKLFGINEDKSNVKSTIIQFNNTNEVLLSGNDFQQRTGREYLFVGGFYFYSNDTTPAGTEFHVSVEIADTAQISSGWSVSDRVELIKENTNKTPSLLGFASKSKDAEGYTHYTSNDDGTCGIQSLVNGIVTEKKSGKAYIPNGVYEFTSPLTVNTKSLMIDGEVWNYPNHPNGVVPSKYGTVFKLNTDDICGIDISTGNGLCVFNIGVVGSDWDTRGLYNRSTPSHYTGVYQSGSYSDQIELRKDNFNGLASAFAVTSGQLDAASIHDCNMDGCNIGIILDGASCIYSKIFNNLIADTPCYGLFVGSTNRGLTVKGNTFVRNGGAFSEEQVNAFGEGKYAVYIANSEACIFTDNVIHYSGTFLDVSNPQNQETITDSDVSGLYFGGNNAVISGNSVYFAEKNAGVFALRGSTISGNYFRGKTGGVILSGNSNAFTGNKVLTAGTYALEVSGSYNFIGQNAVEGGSIRVSGSGNTIICSSRYESIIIESGASGNLLIGYATSQVTDNGTGTIMR